MTKQVTEAKLNVETVHNALKTIPAVRRRPTEDDDRIFDTACLSAVQRHLFAVNALNGNISIDGFDGAYANGYCDLAPDAAEGFDAIGARQHADLVRESLAHFPADSRPPSAAARRWAEIQSVQRTPIKAAWWDLSCRYYDSGEDVWGPLAAYVRRNASHF